MSYTLAKYSVKPEKLKDVKRALREFVAEMKAHEPRTFYLVFRENSTPTFYHLMSFENEAAERKHAQSHYVERFVKKIYPHCLSRPTFAELKTFVSTKKQWIVEC
jgi:quinol monooxygenase YgiN